jgi:hypothetical protein
MKTSSGSRIASLVLVCAALGAGCSSGSTGGDAPAAAPSTSSDDASTNFQCATDPRVATYVANLEKTGATSRARFTLTAANPAPPRRGMNAWTLKVVDTAGNPIAGASVAVSGIMPDHQHGWSTKPTITNGADGATFTVEKMNLFMGGVWNVTFDVSSAGSVVDTATFTFCIG